MPHTNPLRFSAITGALTLLLALAPGAYASSSAQNGSGTGGSETVAPMANGVSRIQITLIGDNGGACVLDHTTAKAGPITFSVTNKTATAITEVELQSDNRILGEKENLAPGLPPVSFTVTLDGGTYQIYCPGAQQAQQPFKVTGQSATRPSGDIAATLAKGTQGYAHYVDGMVDAMVTAVARLKADIDAGDLAKAKAEYPQARVFYERIESDIEGFVLPGYKITDNAGSLDYLIDMRASSLDPKVGWHGFHAIERDLFKYGRITDHTRQLAAELLKNVKHLDKVVKTLHYRPEDLANGAAALLEEVLSNKVTGEEEAFSHYDLVDFAGNIEGAQQAFAFLEPGMMKIDPNLTRQIEAQFEAVDQLLDTYRDPSAPGGFVPYTPALRESDAAKLSRAIQALQEPLSRIAEKVATAGA